MLQAISLKASHARHLPAVVLGDCSRSLDSASMRPANETCERCHAPSSFQDDAARSIRHSSPHEANTERHTYLLPRTGTGAQEASQGYGIDWHISNSMEYIATDDHKQEILWARANLPDGRRIEYFGALNPLTPEEVDRAEKRRIDFVDCHNRIGHPYPSPDTLVDKALTEGQLNPALTYVKNQISALLSAEYAHQNEAMAAADSLRTRYREAYPHVALTYVADIEQAVRPTMELVPRIVFEEPGVTRQSFSDNIGHKTFPGRFRCHDRRHVSHEGESIRLKCSLCHSIPKTVAASDGPPEMPTAARQEPASHLETTFIGDHRFSADDSCVDCHGSIEFGKDDPSFCANSACQGQYWPMVDLDALFDHPIRLEGGHVGVQCHCCHDGERVPMRVPIAARHRPGRTVGRCARIATLPAVSRRPEQMVFCIRCHWQGGTRSCPAARVTPLPNHSLPLTRVASRPLKTTWQEHAKRATHQQIGWNW